MRLLTLFLASALVVTPAPTPFPPELTSELDAVIGRYLTATERQRASLLGAQMEMDIDGRFTKTKEVGRIRIIRKISRLGELGMEKVADFTGDNRVGKYLIGRFLEEEEKSKAYGAMKVTPQDYEFEIRLITKRKGQSTYVFGVQPRSGGKGTFRGELWVDGKTGMPLRETGRLVNSPSIFLTNQRFTRDYELQDGVSVLKHFKGSTDVLLLGVGSAELNIDFSNYSQTPGDAAWGESQL